MKKIILLLTGIIALFAAEAQKNDGGIHLIPRIGINFSNVTIDDYFDVTIPSDTKIRTGFHAGVELESGLSRDLYFQPGVFFSSKGAKFDGVSIGGVNLFDGTIKLSYIEIPLTIFFKPTLGEGRLLLGAGPYAAIAVGAKVDYDDADGQKFKFANKIDFAEMDGNIYMRRSDFGLNLNAGYEHKTGFILQLNAQLGLANNATEIDDAPANLWEDGKFRNTQFSLSAGYRF